GDGDGTMSADEARVVVSQLGRAPVTSGSPPPSEPQRSPVAASPAFAHAAARPPPTLITGGAPALTRPDTKLVIEIAPFVTALLFSSPAPLAEEISLAVSASRQRGAIDVWTEVAYRLPVGWR